MATDIAKSKRVKVFCVPETTSGVLAFPTANHFICPAGDPTLAQVPTYTDSKELSDTLDILNQFTNSMPPAEWSVPMYLRLAGAEAAPQGDALFTAMQGSKQAASSVTAKVNALAGIDASVTNIPYDTVAGGVFPPSGVILIGTEKIRYNRRGGGTFIGCVRGYDSTTAASAADDAAITLLSQVYRQTTEHPSFSLWIMHDWFLRFCSGCTVNNGVIGLKKEDAVMVTLKGQGMRMGWAGESTLTAGASAGATSLVVANAKLFTVGARIQNVTKGAIANGFGFAVTGVDVSTNTLTIGPGLSVPPGGWESGDIIRGYLPNGTPIGTAIECKDIVVKVGGIEGRIRATDLNFDVPKTYLTDVLGAAFPEEYVEDTRKSTTNLNVYFKKNAAQQFYQGYNGEETAVEFILGRTVGYKASLYYPRVKLSVPTMRAEGAAVVLEIPVTALGTVGEDSFYLSLE